MPKNKYEFDVVLKEIQQLNDKEPDGFAVIEMADALGRSPEWCRKRIKEMISVGKMDCVGKKRLLSIDGTYRPVPAYRLKK